MFRGKFGRVHFVGIGGSGMSGIAEVLLTMGYAVSGSDQKEGGVVARLRALGGRIAIGHHADHVRGVDVVVRSTAIPDHNPEIVAAHAAKIPVIPRAEMLAELMRMKYGLAVAGTHGKTTTTSMLATCLHRAGLDPTVVIGGRLDAFGSSARLGRGDYLVAEADESDGSFLLLHPTVAVITNVDPEHMEHWKSFDALVDGFVSFANRVPFYGFSVVCLDHPVVQKMMPRLRRRVISYGLEQQAEVRADRIRQEGRSVAFRAWRRDEALGELRLAVPGRHNVRNALAATAVALELDIPFARIQEALEGFGGVDRRFSERANVGDVLIIDDYGHHPVEIRATLGAAAEGYEGRRIVAVFQPHRYSRVHDLHDDFCAAFNAASHVVVCPVYAAGEPPIDGVSAESLARGMSAQGHRSVHVAADLDAATEHLAGVCRPGDIVVTLGAGDVNRVCGALAARLGNTG
ncbi:MAG: UDP-N-acetylmuramate--L-alanine ligase [Pseudomonadota bacterium]|jgi:UDP-N-acetylmuramate--alanine ligase